MDEPKAIDPDIPAHAPSRKRQLVQASIALVVLVLVFGFVFPQLADYERVLDYIAAIDPAEWLVLSFLAAVVLLAYVFVLVAALRTLRPQEAYVSQTAAQAVVNTLPAGGAVALPLQYAMLMSWGFTPESVTAMFLAVGIWDQFARFGLPIFALTIAAFTQSTPWWTWAIAIGGVVLIVLAIWVVHAVFSREKVAKAVGAFVQRTVNWVLKRLHRPPMEVATGVMQFRANAIDVVRHRWKPITGTTIVNHSAQAGLFLASLRAVGVTEEQIPAVWVIASFAVGRLLAMIPASPGGLGLVDLGWLGMLSLGWQTGTTDTELIAAGAVLYRALTFLPPIAAGAVSWVLYATFKSWRRNWRLERRGDWSSVS